MASGIPPPHEKKRVKVYELRNNDWFDRGTGFCTGRVLHEESKIVVESEDQPERMLLDTKISKDDAYQKQQETLIVWTESGGPDMALSFQESEGCASIWQVHGQLGYDDESHTDATIHRDFVSRVQQHLLSLGPDDALSDDAMDNFANQFMLPPCELKHLDEIEHTMRGAVSTPQGRDALSKCIIGENYVQKLLPLVADAEDLESLEDLHHLCNIMKMIILLNDSHIIEMVVSDEIVDGVVGALEYDPEFPMQKANHRRYLQNGSRYKEVVPISDPTVRVKIHSTWRLQYLKDVVLARILDDPTFSVLNSLIFFNQVEIVNHLQANTAFLEELFQIIDSPDVEIRRKKDAVGFIQQCCAIAKNLQAPARASLYNNFIQNGLLSVITFALLNKDASVRIAGTDILVAMIDHDASMVRSYIFKAIAEKKTPLTDTLIELLLVEVDLGVKAQASDAIKILLEQPPVPPPVAPPTGPPGASPGTSSAAPQASPPAQEAPKTNGEFLTKLRVNSSVNNQIESFIQHFFDGSAHKLFQPLKDLERRKSLSDLSFHDVSLLTHLVEILMFLTRQHIFRSKYFIFSEGLATRIAQLLTCPQKHLKLTALKFFRSCMNLQDEFYIRQITQNRLFEPILDIVYETMPRDNLLNSACLELFESIKRENMKPFIIHLVENYRERLEQITYVDTFSTLILRYDQYRQGYNPDSDHPLYSQGDDTSPTRRRLIENPRWPGGKEMDPTEEAYFNTSDDEDEIPTRRRSINGSSPLLRSLVDYPDDDEDILDTRAAPPEALSPSPYAPRADPSSPSSMTSSPPSASLSSTPTLPTPRTPPERLAEKRRREEDEEEDELGKLTITKRRTSSMSSIASSVTSNLSNSLLRRKKGLASAHSKSPPTSAKKIEISLAVKGPRERDSKRDEGG